MIKHTLISVYNTQTTIATVQDNELVDLHIDCADHNQQKSNIYMARISKIEPSLNAIFVDYGNNKDAFIPIKEISRECTLNNDEISSDNIRENLKVGQNIVIQIVKDKRGIKGAYATTFISLSGVYIVYLPTSNKPHGISKCIQETERNRLRAILDKLNIKGQVIIRTACINTTESFISQDFKILKDIWKKIIESSINITTPSLLYRENSISARIMRDYLTSNTGNIVIDKKEVFTELRDMLSIARPHLLPKVKLFAKAHEHIFEYYGVQNDIGKIFNREISLKSGGSIIIDHTEALTSIDVNSSRSTKHKSITETSFHTNKEALIEIARQIKFRNIGGIVVIDLIDLSSNEQRTSLEDMFINELSSDKARIQMTRISPLGLIELSRQQVYSPVRDMIMTKCVACAGIGRILPDTSFALSIIKKIKAYIQNNVDVHNSIMVNVSHNIAKLIIEEHFSDIYSIEKRHKIKLLIFAESNVQSNYFQIKNMNKDLPALELQINDTRDGLIHGKFENRLINFEREGNILQRMWNYFFKSDVPYSNEIDTTKAIKANPSRIKIHPKSEVNAIERKKEIPTTAEQNLIDKTDKEKKRKKPSGNDHSDAKSEARRHPRSKEFPELRGTKKENTNAFNSEKIHHKNSLIEEKDYVSSTNTSGPLPLEKLPSDHYISTSSYQQSGSYIPIDHDHKDKHNLMQIETNVTLIKPFDDKVESYRGIPYSPAIEQELQGVKT